MAELDWGGLYSQSHVMAKGFAAEGHRVFYINRTLQRWPLLSHLITRLRPTASRGVVGVTTKISSLITVINLWVGPPVWWLRPLNKFLISLKLKKYDITKPIFLTYVPTYNSIGVADYIKPVLQMYVCYHNFDADVVLADLLKSEKEIVMKSDLLFADSRFLMNRIAVLSGGRKVIQSPPGVHFEKFKATFRGDEVARLKKICFYGGAGLHLDIDTYNRLCHFYDVTFIAVINPAIQNMLDSRIQIINPVSNDLLPGLLRDMDVLTILYKRSDYIDGVLPAKFFECIATGKPVLVSGLVEANYFSEYVYDIQNNPEKAIQILKELSQTHTRIRVNSQFELGKSADFELRFKNVYDEMVNALKLKDSNI